MRNLNVSLQYSKQGQDSIIITVQGWTGHREQQDFSQWAESTCGKIMSGLKLNISTYSLLPIYNVLLFSLIQTSFTVHYQTKHKLESESVPNTILHSQSCTIRILHMEPGRQLLIWPNFSSECFQSAEM